jgi:hypothetical protein
MMIMVVVVVVMINNDSKIWTLACSETYKVKWVEFYSD